MAGITAVMKAVQYRVNL